MHEEAGTFTLLPGARGYHGPFGARAAPVRYRAVGALVGLDVRRNLRYFTPVFSVAFEGVWGGQLENLKILRKMPKLLSLERD